MPALPRVTSKQIIKVLERATFVVSRSSGTHHIYTNSAGRRVTVPVHASRILHPKVLKSILEDAGWSVEEFILRLAG